MVSDWPDLILAAIWLPGDGTAAPTLRLTLTNEGRSPVEGFRLAISGPARVSDGAPVAGGRIVRQLSNYCELAPEPAAALEPGASWTLEIGKLDSPIRHWTDGPQGAFVVLEDGVARPVRCLPIRHHGRNHPLRQGTMRLEVAPTDPTVSVIPWPLVVEVAGRRTAPAGLSIDAGGHGHVAAAFGRLCSTLFPAEGLVREVAEGGYPVRLVDGDSEPEGYQLDFNADDATITAGSDAGLLYGLVSLAQIARGARLHPDRFVFPTEGRITDAPQMEWRGSHLDVARRFYAGAEIERFLAVLAWNKLNRFHWHLSDDEGFRVALEGFPEVASIAAWRGHGLPLPPLLGTGPEPHGGSYGQREIRDLVALASGWGIEVIPEIDVPGHCHALLTALPQLRDSAESGAYFSIQSFPNNCLNPGSEAVHHVLGAILDELAGLFPGRYLHLGADEVPADAWSHSPLADALRRRLGTTGAAPLQAHLLSRMQSRLTAAGKITGAWEEAAEGGGIDRESCYLVGWRTLDSSRHLAAEGYKVVVSPGQAYYLDMANAEDWEECGAGWAGWSSPEKTYRLDPADGWSSAERENLLGVQAAIWSEPMHNPAIFDRLVFPRLSALAETGWTAAGRKDFLRFSAAAGLMPNLYGHWESG